MGEEYIVKVSFRVTSNWRISEDIFTPFELVKKEWKGQVGNKTADGDLILEVKEISKDEIEVIIEVLSPKTRKMFGGEIIPVSFSIQ